MKTRNVLSPKFADYGGTIPVIVQDSRSRRVIGFAFTSEDNYLAALSTREVVLHTAGASGEWVQYRADSKLALMDAEVSEDGHCLVYHVLVEGQTFPRNDFCAILCAPLEHPLNTVSANVHFDLCSPC